jgi:hypothetical protein
MANRLSVRATSCGTRDWLDAGIGATGGNGLLAPSTADFACAATSLAASESWPLVSASLPGFLAVAFLAGAFFATAFFAGAFLAGAFAVFLTALAGGLSAGGVDPRRRLRCGVDPAGLPCGRSFADFSATWVPSCQDAWRRHPDRKLSRPAPHRPYAACADERHRYHRKRPCRDPVVGGGGSGGRSGRPGAGHREPK